jgi:glutaredoxin 3
MKVTIYSKDSCVHCNNAKMLLASRNIPYQELKLNEDFTRENLLELFPNSRSFPIIVVDGFNIGGYTELSKMILEETSDNRKLLTEGEWNGR